MSLSVELAHFFATLPPQAMKVEVVFEPFASRMEFCHWEITIRPPVAEAESALLRLIPQSTGTSSECFPNHLVQSRSLPCFALGAATFTFAFAFGFVATRISFGVVLATLTTPFLAIPFS